MRKGYSEVWADMDQVLIGFRARPGSVSVWDQLLTGVRISFCPILRLQFRSNKVRRWLSGGG